MTFTLGKLLRAPSPAARASCELCALPIEDPVRHGHVVDTTDRRILCACRACSLLFPSSGAGVRFKVVPEQYVAVPSPLFSEAQWDALGIPIGLAFFFENSVTGRVVAFYPGPAGATESQLPLEAWDDLKAREPCIGAMQADVQAALVYRRRDASTQAYVVPIDVCYELVGIVRSTWSGISGGDSVEQAIEAFFSRIAERAA